MQEAGRCIPVAIFRHWRKLEKRLAQIESGTMHAALIERIRSGTLTEKELINLHNNSRDRNFPEVMAAVEVQMRSQFARAANKLYGKKK